MSWDISLESEGRGTRGDIHRPMVANMWSGLVVLPHPIPFILFAFVWLGSLGAGHCRNLMGASLRSPKVQADWGLRLSLLFLSAPDYIIPSLNMHQISHSSQAQGPGWYNRRFCLRRAWTCGWHVRARSARICVSIAKVRCTMRVLESVLTGMRYFGRQEAVPERCSNSCCLDVDLGNL